MGAPLVGDVRACARRPGDRKGIGCGTVPGMTGAADELVDVVDEHGQVIDVVARRRMRAENLRHRAVFVAILSTDGRVLVHRRADHKDVWPGRWDLAIGGVVVAGEGWDDAARREVAEEIGVDASPTAWADG